jgi:hypothetical protein
MAPVTDPRGINLEGIADGDLLRYDTTPGQFVKLTPPDAPVVPAAITGGEPPTEAEYNALRLALATLVADLTTAGLLQAP